MNNFAEFLSRFQFGFTACYHIMFPALSIGLAWFLVLIHGLYLKTGKADYFRIYKFWTSIFALNFSVGVVTGIFMSFQFGLNWSKFSYAAGPVLGSIIGLEVMTAFFLEAGFLGIMLLGWNRVNKKVHFFATLMVAVGTVISAAWILGANSWLHTPAGYKVNNGQYFIVEWWQALFNPSFFVRFPHMLLASMFSGCFFVAGISAWYLLKGTYTGFARTCFSITMGVITVLIPIQLWLGDAVANKLVAYQPAKLEAMEGNWEDAPNASYLFFINPDSKNQRNTTQIGIPYLGSFLVTHNVHGIVPGLKRTPPKEQPNMAMTFYFFRIMFIMGVMMFFVALTSVSLRFTGKLFTTRWFLKLCLWMMPAGVIATIAGWITSESGRQPYIIYGLLRTAEASTSLSSFQVIFSFGLFVMVYAVLLTAYILFVRKIVRKGPETIQETSATEGHKKENFISGLPETIKLSAK